MIVRALRGVAGSAADLRLPDGPVHATRSLCSGDRLRLVFPLVERGTALHVAARSRSSAHPHPLATPSRPMPSRTTDIPTACRLLAAGGVVAFPTETVYGLGADAENPAAVRRIFAIKGRPASHPLIVHLGNAAALSDWASAIPDTARTLARRFWPGPLTLVLERNARVPLEVTGGRNTVALRVPDHPVALELLRQFGGGLAAPSANRYCAVSPTTAEHVATDLGDDVDGVLDGGPCRVGLESTIVDVSSEHPRVLRPGGVTLEQLEEELQRPLAVGTDAKVPTPGDKPLHYAPRARVILARADELTQRAEQLRITGQRVGLLLTGTAALPFDPNWVVLRTSDVEAGMARELYAFLREFDRQRCDVVLVSLPAEVGLGRAIADRLRRSAGPRPQRQ